MKRIYKEELIDYWYGTACKCGDTKEQKRWLCLNCFHNMECTNERDELNEACDNCHKWVHHLNPLDFQ